MTFGIDGDLGHTRRITRSMSGLKNERFSTHGSIRLLKIKVSSLWEQRKHRMFLGSEIFAESMMRKNP